MVRAAGPLTGLPAVLARTSPSDGGAVRPPSIVLHPRPRRLEELRDAHVELRRRLRHAGDGAEASRVRIALGLASDMGRALRTAGLWNAYVAAARRSRLAGRPPVKDAGADP